MITLWDVANAAKIPEVSPADVVTMLAARVPKGKKMGALPVGQVFVLPNAAQVGTKIDPRNQQYLISINVCGKVV